jgi:hypothetical protein
MVSQQTNAFFGDYDDTCDEGLFVPVLPQLGASTGREASSRVRFATEQRHARRRKSPASNRCARRRLRRS